MEFDRFDFEQAIFSAWTGNDEDIGIILEAIDNEEPLEDIRSLVEATLYLQTRKFQKIFSMLRAGVEERKIL